jgi:tetratricopeptide (TPR) repeat protein
VTALGYNPYHEASLYNYGVLLREKGEHFKAEDTFRRYVSALCMCSIGKTCTDTLMDLTYLLGLAGDAFRCLAVNPQHQGALVHLGLAMYRQHKDTVRARELFQRAIDNDPHDYNAM